MKPYKLSPLLPYPELKMHTSALELLQMDGHKFQLSLSKWCISCSSKILYYHSERYIL